MARRADWIYISSASMRRCVVRLTAPPLSSPPAQERLVDWCSGQASGVRRQLEVYSTPTTAGGIDTT